jgi:ferric-dicitrate binding protein FerR (iron transport regulator)
MTSPFRTDPAVLDSLRRGDEKALERLFRGSYNNLVSVAKNELGEQAASANRVVEKVFVRVWNERESFASPDALDKFVQGTVHEAAVRERSRLGALKRMEHGSGTGGHKAAEATVDDSWSRITSSLHAGTASSDARDPGRTSRAAAAHMKQIGPKKGAWIVPTAVLAGTVIAAWAGISFLARGGEEVVLTNALAQADVKITTTAPGQIANMTLDDGSTLKLAPNSRVRIPTKFATTVRGIRIDGTAQITAAAGQKQPLEVRVGKSAISMTDGIVDVKADSVTGVVFARLRQGTATLKTGKVQPAPMAVGAAVALDSLGASSTPDAGTLADALGWTDGQVTINARPLRDVIKLMKQWWGLELYLKDPKLGDRLVTMTADLGTTKPAIAALEKGGELKFGYESGNMILTDGKKK